jgi:RHS repeat-associated protein
MSGYSTGTGNRLTSDGTYNYTYDDNGNTLTKTRISDSQKWEFTWDFRNRLTQVVVKNSGGTILQQSDFTYDAFDRRIIKSFDDDGPGPHSASVTKTIYDGSSFAANPYADFDGNNTLTMRYLYGPAVDMVLARRNASGTVAWHLRDHLGSIHDVASTSGAVIDHIRYSAFGIVAAESSPSNGDRFKFTGREYDLDISMYYYRKRYLNPSTSRFLQEDPIRFAAGDSNLFRYVGNNPVGDTDPTGLCTCAHPSGQIAMAEALSGSIAPGSGSITIGSSSTIVSTTTASAGATTSLTAAEAGVAQAAARFAAVRAYVNQAIKEAHHLLPRGLRAQFSSFHVNTQKHIVTLVRDLHKYIHGKGSTGFGPGGPWNQAWKEFLAVLKNQQASIQGSQGAIQQYMDFLRILAGI